MAVLALRFTRLSLETYKLMLFLKGMTDIRYSLFTELFRTIRSYIAICLN